MTDRKPRVYVANRGSHDYSPAEQYGDIVFVTEGIVPRLDVNKLSQMVGEVLVGAEEGDFLLISGLSVVNSIAAGILARRFGRINFLLFHRGYYIEKNVLIDMLIVETEEIGGDA